MAYSSVGRAVAVGVSAVLQQRSHPGHLGWFGPYNSDRATAGAYDMGLHAGRACRARRPHAGRVGGHDEGELGVVYGAGFFIGGPGDHSRDLSVHDCHRCTTKASLRALIEARTAHNNAVNAQRCRAHSGYNKQTRSELGAFVGVTHQRRPGPGTGRASY